MHINDWRKIIYPWVMWTMAASFFFYKNILQFAPSVITNELMEVFQIDGSGLGNLSAFYFYAYFIMQIPVGILLDKYSPRLLTTGAILVCGVSTIIFSQAHTLWLALASRGLCGLGAAFAAVSCFKFAAVWFAPHRFAFVSGMFMTVAMLGAIAGQMPLSLLIQHMGGRLAFATLGVIGIFLSLFYYAIVRDKSTPDEGLLKNKKEIGPILVHILSNKQTWLIALYASFIYATVSIFGGLWGIPFLQIAYHLSKTSAAFAVSCIFLGFAVGAPFWGWFSDYMGRRKPVLFIGSFLSLFCISTVLYVPGLFFFVLVILLFLFGFFASSFFTSFAMVRELFPVALAATVLGVMNTVNAACEALSQPAVGLLLDWTWQGKTLNGIHLFSVQGYYLSLLILPVLIILALITLLFIKETYCQDV